MNVHSFTQVSDDFLVAAMPRLAGNERTAAADFVSGLAEFDGRKLYLGLGFASTYSYCAARLHLTDGAAYRRIEAARASRRFPIVLDMLRDGRLSLATAALIASHLAPADGEALLREVAFKSKREVELMLARRHPKPAVPAVLRARERLTQIQGLMRHRLPSGDPAAIVEHALEVLHAQLLKEKAAQVAQPRHGRAGTAAKGRYIPASVKREVWRRDQGRCAFIASDGRKCGSDDGVEFHHVQPFAVGGDATMKNIEMRCRAHNGFEWSRHLDQESLALAGKNT